MKNLIPLAILSVLFVTASSAKSRIGQYILGFGYSMADSGSDDREGDFLRITAQAPNSSSTDLGVYLDYGTMKSEIGRAHV